MIETTKRNRTISLIKMAVMAALVCFATFSFKVPTLNGYTHLGDSMIFISVVLLGGRKGAFAGAMGAALADLIGGYMIWIIPTFIIKYAMAVTMSFFIMKFKNEKSYNWIIGAVLGAIVQIMGYTFTNYILFGLSYAVAEFGGLIVQSIAGLICAIVIITMLVKANLLNRLKER